MSVEVTAYDIRWLKQKVCAKKDMSVPNARYKWRNV